MRGGNEKGCDYGQLILNVISWTYLQYGGRAEGADLVQADAVDDNSVVNAAHLLEGSGHERNQVLPEDPNDRPLSSCRVGHRAEDVEARPYAKAFPNWSDEPHGGMVDGSEHEGDATRIDALRHLGWGDVDLDPKGFQDVGRPASRRYRAITSLCDCAAACGGQNDGGRGNIDGVGPIPSGAHDVEELLPL